MRWKSIKYAMCGLTRTRSWFAFVPVWIKDEVRWLEIVTVKQKYSYGWINIHFIDEDKGVYK